MLLVRHRVRACVWERNKPEMRLDLDLAPELVLQTVLLQLLLEQHLQRNYEAAVSPSALTSTCTQKR